MQEARWQLELDEVLLMPAGRAPHRTVEPEPGPEERWELCRLAAEGAEWLSASRAEVDRPGPSYTADTLAALAEERAGTELHFVLGADQALQLGAWHEPEPGPEERWELARLAAEGAEWLSASRAEVDRPGPSYTADTLAALAEERPGTDLHFVLGADQALQLGTWHEPDRVLALASLSVVERDGMQMEEVRKAVTAVEATFTSSTWSRPTRLKEFSRAITPWISWAMIIASSTARTVSGASPLARRFCERWSATARMPPRLSEG